jgi:hypothetical protein
MMLERDMLMKLVSDMIYVTLNTLLLCLAMLGRVILAAGLILCFGTMPIVQVANAQIASQSPVAAFNCSGFASTGSCGVEFPSGGSGQPFWVGGSPNGSVPALSGTQVDLIPSGAVHNANSLIYQTLVNVQSFSSTFTFIPNGQNISLVIQNSTNSPWGSNGRNFSGGAGCEAGFFQAFAQAAPPNNVFALELDSYSPLTQNGSFTYSSVQYYTPGVYASNAPNAPGQSPCNPNQGGTIFTYASVTKVSTSPVNLTNGSQNTTTGHTYSATVTYDGNNLTISLYDVTAGGSCPGANCFTYSWSGVDIPSIVGGSNTAWVGLVGATGNPSPTALYINSFSYSSLGPALQVTPATNIAASGTQGGPFSPSSFSYTLSATTGSVNYTVTNVPNWLTASTASGTVTSGTPVTVTFTVNANANSLAANTYSGNINFTNLATGQGSQTRTASLTVNAASTAALQVTPATNIAASGTQGGPFSPSSFSYSFRSTTGTVNYSITNVPSWLTVSSSSGTATTSPRTITFSINSNANNLSPSTYMSGINFNNTTNNQGNKSITATLTVASGGGKTPSLDGTTIPSATQITDAQLNVWTVASGVIYENGSLAGYSANVVLLLYYNGVIYQENSAGGWWSWVNSNWSGVAGDPRPKKNR